MGEINDPNITKHSRYYIMLEQYYDKNGWNNIIGLDQLQNVDNFLNNIVGIKYIGHGGTCIAFINSDKVVIKVCLKNRMVTCNSKTFIAFSKCLQGNGIKILPILDILFEDDNFFVYTQHFCHTIININALVLSKILKIITKLIKRNIKITDLFYKNFGIYKNEVYLYDYHDYGFFYSDDHYYLTHIAQLFNVYYNKELLYGITLDFDILKEMKYGHNILPKRVVDFIESMYNHQLSEGIKLIIEINNEVDEQIEKTFDNYQHFDVNSDGELHLRSHTLEKYNAFNELVQSNPGDFEGDFTIIDYGCSLGGIGTKIAQQYPNSFVTLNNITKDELNVCVNNINASCLTNIKVNDQNVVNDKSTYDVCLYYALLHHILKIKSFDEIIKMVYDQTKLYAIIELPFSDDALLKKVMEESMTYYEESYKYLESVDIFCVVVKKWFSVLSSKKIHYGSHDLNRYVFTLKKM